MPAPSIPGISTVTNVIDGKTVTDYFDPNGVFLGGVYEHADGSGTWFTPDGASGNWTPDTGYWTLGVSLGLGFQVWGDTNGDLGFNWTSGLGLNIQAGDMSSPQQVINTFDQSGFDFTRTIDPFPSTITWDANGLSFDHLGFDFGAQFHDPDPMSWGTPQWATDFTNAVSSELGWGSMDSYTLPDYSGSETLFPVTNDSLFG